MLPLVVTVEGADRHVRRYAFAESPVTVGRSPFAELQLLESSVSRWEGTLRFDEREVTYCSFGSTNATLVDGVELPEGQDVVLGPNQVLSIGALNLRLSRDWVPESDLRRKGKRRPATEDERTALKTAYLRAERPHARGAAEPGAEPGTARAVPSAPELEASSDSNSSAAADHRAPMSRPAQEGVRVLGRITITGSGPARSDAPASPLPALPIEPFASGPAGHASKAPEPSVGRVAASSAASQVSAPASSQASAEPLARLHAQYRETWRVFLRQVTDELERRDGQKRAEYAARLQKRFPEIVNDPESRELLRRFGLPLERPAIPEVREWLIDVAKDVLPAKLELDTGVTLDRILALLETLTQSLGEINDSQESIRRKWLGRAPRRSVLRSDNGRAILAYLLNPQANWSERLLELEQTVRDVVTHELALFKATLDGVRTLLDTLSPDVLAKEEGVERSALQREGEAGLGLWGRLRPGSSVEARLWRRFTSAYEALRDNDRYQRVFLGRGFARSYLAALGQPSKDPE